MNPSEYDWQLGALADMGIFPDERGLQPPPPDQPWPQQRLANPGEGQAWNAPPTNLARFPSQPSDDASTDVAIALRDRYRNALSRDPTSNKIGDLAEMVAPQSPIDYALMATGPLRALPVAARGLTYGAALALHPEEALAGPAGKILKGVSKLASRGEPAAERTAERLTGFAPGEAFAPSRKLASPEEFANPKLRAKAEALFGKYPQYAENYPETGPPQLMSKVPDPKNPGKFLSKADKPVPYTTMEEALAKDAEPGFFLEKKLTPEAAQFQKDRATILKDMDEHGYVPYFDPAKRFDVNPKHYGPFDDTAVAASPKTVKTYDEWYEKYGTPEARGRLQEGYEKGLLTPESERWYLMGQLEQKYIKELGAKEGRAAFKREFADMMAATTGGASPYNNWLMAHYANVMAKRGERMPERSYELPFPIGGRYAAGNIEQAQKYIDEGMKGFSAEQNPKRYDFSSAFQGNRNAFVMDEQMMQAIEPGTNIPQWYGPATRVGREEARAAKVDPRGFQDVGWAGLKGLKTEAKGQKFEYEGPMIGQVNRSIEVTHRLTGMPREEIVRRGVIRKEIPMYTIGGSTAMGGLAAQDKYEYQ